MILKVRLSYPDSKLNPNHYRGRYWTSTSKAKRMARETGYICAVVAGGFDGDPCFDSGFADDKPMSLRIGIFPPDNRRRDMDNTVAACKSFQDGVFDYLGLDDRLIKRKTIVWHNRCKKGKIYYILYQ